MAYRGLSARLIGDVGRSGMRLIGDPGLLIGSLVVGVDWEVFCRAGTEGSEARRQAGGARGWGWWGLGRRFGCVLSMSRFPGAFVT